MSRFDVIVNWTESQNGKLNEYEYVYMTKYFMIMGQWVQTEHGYDHSVLENFGGSFIASLLDCIMDYALVNIKLIFVANRSNFIDVLAILKIYTFYIQKSSIKKTNYLILVTNNRFFNIQCDWKVTPCQGVSRCLNFPACAKLLMRYTIWKPVVRVQRRGWIILNCIHRPMQRPSKVSTEYSRLLNLQWIPKQLCGFSSCSIQ